MDSFKGHFLVAMPGLIDLNFYQSVICVCEHTKEGAMGIIVNYVHPFLSIKDLFDELKIECLPEVKKQAVHLGGNQFLDGVDIDVPGFDVERRPIHEEGVVEQSLGGRAGLVMRRLGSLVLRQRGGWRAMK